MEYLESNRSILYETPPPTTPERKEKRKFIISNNKKEFTCGSTVFPRATPTPTLQQGYQAEDWVKFIATFDSTMRLTGGLEPYA